MLFTEHMTSTHNQSTLFGVHNDETMAASTVLPLPLNNNEVPFRRSIMDDNGGGDSCSSSVCTVKTSNLSPWVVRFCARKVDLLVEERFSKLF